MKRISYDYTNLMADVVGERGIRDEDLDTIAPRVRAAVEDLVDLAGDPEVRFPNLPEQDWSELLTYAQEAQRRFEHLVVLGIGGSALGARAVYSALVRPHSGKHRDGRERQGPTLHVIDNVDPLTLVDLLDELNLDKTLFNVVTKSGNTIETMSAFFLVRERLIADFGLSGYRERVVCTTDPARGALRQIVKQDHLRSFEVPPGVGGRFSVLTAVGLLPLAICGLDVTALLKGARDARDNAFEPTVETNIAAMFAATQVLLYDRQVHDVVLMPYSDALIDSAAWFVQLWAESLAKRVPGTDSVVGPTPIAARGATDQHSQLQLYMEGPATKNIVFIEVAQEGEPTVVPNVRAQSEGLAHLGEKPLHAIQLAELEGVRAGLAEEARPTSTFHFDDVSAETLGAFLMTLECATSIAGSLLGIDPFNQPGVELGKRFAHGLLGRAQEAHYAEKLRSTQSGRITRKVTM